MTNLICPACGFAADIEGFRATVDWQRAVVLAHQVPSGLAVPLQAYLRLFSVPGKALTARRYERLLAELLPGLQAARIERKGRAYAAPARAWEDAFDAIAAAREAGTLRLPLKSHGYLLEIMAASAERIEARAEARTEERKRADSAALHVSETAPPRRMPDHVRGALAQYITPKPAAEPAKEST